MSEESPLNKIYDLMVSKELSESEKREVNEIYKYISDRLLVDIQKYRSLVENYERKTSELKEELSQLEKHLNFQPEPTVNYDFIEDSRVQKQLYNDNREMLKARGIGNGNEDFGEFCRFGFYQIEMASQFFFLLFEHYRGETPLFSKVKRIFYENCKKKNDGLSNVCQKSMDDSKSKMFKSGFLTQILCLRRFFFEIKNELDESINFEIIKDGFREIRNLKSHPTIKINKTFEWYFKDEREKNTFHKGRDDTNYLTFDQIEFKRNKDYKTGCRELISFMKFISTLIEKCKNTA